MRKRRMIIISAVAAIAVIAAIVTVILSYKTQKRQSGTMTQTPGIEESLCAEEETKTSAVVIPEETEPDETEPDETEPDETEPEVPTLEYIDAHGAWHEMKIDENAVPCRYPSFALSHDNAGNALYDEGFEETEDYYELERGIDVSSNQGDISWYDVRSSRIDFAIIRAVYRECAEAGGLCVDEKFEKNYTEAYKVGVKTGMYVSSQAHNEDEAIEEAELALSLIDNRPLDMFIAYDPVSVCEEGRTDEVNKEQLTRNAIAFCERIKQGGYTPAIYSDMVWEDERFDMALLSDKYQFWYADCEEHPQSPYAFTTWQYSRSGGIQGIDGPVDLNVSIAKPRAESETEKQIYSYVQIPVEYYENSVWTDRRICNEGWTGDWAHIQAGGQEFFWFGCGICCLSNTVSTLTGEDIPPDVMFQATMEHTDYSPEGGHGAVSWGEMKAMCTHYGLSAELKNKPSEYETFRDDVADADTTVVVLCRDNDKRLWWYTKGHYVNVWDYDEKTGTVFVTDPSMHYNRQRVQLIDVYHALKTANPAQYMNVKRT